MNTILVDIGGTYVRFAQMQGDGFDAPVKYRAADFKTFEDALRAFLDTAGLQGAANLAIATAGYEDGGVWKFVNKNTWQISPAALEAAGHNIQIILNDFEAATWALSNLDDSEGLILKAAPGASSSYCLLGPGTGLGLGYLHRTGTAPYVQKTHGGHIPLACVSDEQQEIANQLRQILGPEKTLVFENVVSGPGLYNLYRAVCAANNQDTKAQNENALLDHLDDPHVKTALRLFHEFLGLFAGTVTVAGHAYGGLYLTGGVLQHLTDHDVFDFKTFENFFCFNAVASVKRDLNATPVKYITLPYPALKGLIYAQSLSDN